MCDVTVHNIVLLMRQWGWHGVEMAIWCSVGKGDAFALPVGGGRRCRERAGETRLARGRGLMSSAILGSFRAFLLEH